MKHGSSCFSAADLVSVTPLVFGMNEFHVIGLNRRLPSTDSARFASFHAARHKARRPSSAVRTAIGPQW